jgi:ribokinase
MTAIAVVGSIAMDLVAVSTKRPTAGETVIGEEFHIVPGGKGANQAVAAARLGASVHMIGAVGQDANGEAVLANLRNEHIVTEHIKVTSHATTGTAHIIVAEGDNSIVVIPGANGHVDRTLIEEAKQILLQAAVVVMQLEIPLDTVQYVLELCNAQGVPVILNPAPAQSLPSRILDKLAYITPNEHECRVVLNDFTSTIEELLAQYPNKLLLTEGEQGVRFHNGMEVVRVAGIHVEPVDTTGAGDTFNGALAVALAEGKNLEQAIRFANIAAGISVTKLGAQGGMPTRDKVRDGYGEEEACRSEK